MPIARRAHTMRTPRMVFAWCARSVRFASRCGNGQSIRPHAVESTVRGRNGSQTALAYSMRQQKTGTHHSLERASKLL
eukprot:10722120-Lingulodinium_polyedra.AAC.1